QHEEGGERDPRGNPKRRPIRIEEGQVFRQFAGEEINDDEQNKDGDVFEGGRLHFPRTPRERNFIRREFIRLAKDGPLNLVCGGNRRGSQGVEIGEKVVKLLRGERAAKGGHHPATLLDGLSNEPVVGRQAAGKIFFPEESFQAGAIQGRGRG